MSLVAPLLGMRCHSRPIPRSPVSSFRHSAIPPFRHSSIPPFIHFVSPPAWPLVRADPQRQLRRELVGQHRVRRVYPAQSRIAEQPFERTLTEDSESTGQVEGAIHDPPCSLPGGFYRIVRLSYVQGFHERG